MPVQRCQEGGRNGWRWGKQGKCYIGGLEAKKKALKQGYAEDPKHFAEVATAEEINEIICDSNIPLLDKVVLREYIDQK